MSALRSASRNDVKKRKLARDRSPKEFQVEREIFEDTISEHTLGTQLWWAVQEYLLSHKYALDPTQFRRQLLSFERRVNSLLAEIPSSDSALALAIDSGAREINKFVEVGENSEASSFEEQVDIDNLKSRIGALSQTLKTIRSGEQGRGRDANRAAHQFVETLAQIFTEYTGQVPSRSNDPSREWVDAVNGPFGNFVKAVHCQLPQHLQLTDIDNLIRHAVFRQRS